MNELGAKKDTYTNSRCMSSGILIGRMSSGLTSFKRALDDKKAWSPAYGIAIAARPANDAARDLERFLPAARPDIKRFMEIMERYKDSGYGLDREVAAKKLEEARKHLSDIAQIAVKSCGKARPQEGEGEALLRMKRVKRAPVMKRTPEPARPPEAALPVLVEPPQEESGTPWGVLAGLVLVIGAAFLAR